MLHCETRSPLCEYLERGAEVCLNESGCIFGTSFYLFNGAQGGAEGIVRMKTLNFRRWIDFCGPFSRFGVTFECSGRFSVDNGHSIYSVAACEIYNATLVTPMKSFNTTSDDCDIYFAINILSIYLCILAYVNVIGQFQQAPKSILTVAQAFYWNSKPKH